MRAIIFLPVHQLHDPFDHELLIGPDRQENGTAFRILFHSTPTWVTAAALSDCINVGLGRHRCSKQLVDANFK